MPGAGLNGIDSILIELGADSTRIALLRNGELIELLVERAGHESRLGWIFLGRVAEVVKPLNAAFVDIGQTPPAFLSGAAAHWLHPDVSADTPIGRSVTEGAAVLVQQVKDAQGDAKGAAVTADISLAGTHLVFTPRRPGIAVSRKIPDKAERARLRQTVLDCPLPAQAGLVVRTSAQGADAAALRAELTGLLARWQGLLDKAAALQPPAVLDRPPGLLERLLGEIADDCAIRAELTGFTRARRYAEAHRPALLESLSQHRGPTSLFAAEGVEEQIAAALERRVPLPGGGELVIDPTEALVAIDVNSGGRAPREAAFAAVGPVARQICLRALSGLILADFPRLDARADRARLLDALRQAVAGDRVPVQVLGYTNGGLVELIRPRDRDTLAEQLAKG
ncbi:ribonuclease E/G [Oceanibaculum pacificum]|uniref:RNA-binding protein AU-1/Ribonuclease E/G domain-containing protein n=1 Tax=Oceanibaculum pacificum TaxID=580166 RepID=A0A154W5Y0_9PROT|nr:ribonuclease E/G [Oceanibaculum pacificum]KZD08955.1 hypothetical protein AUP43_08045 [Oceanibaculum pacificum]